ncbi:protein kinase [Pelomyxa schiedti]|nr:protein kinase [Pelomyxa schiedti]
MQQSFDKEPWSEPLKKLVEAIRIEEGRERSLKSLRDFVLWWSRGFCGEAFSKFVGELNSHLTELIDSSESSDKYCAVLAIEQLLEPEFDENVAHFYFLLHSALQASENNIMTVASHALGRLASIGGHVCSDCVERELSHALQLLPQSLIDRKLCGLLVMKELAKNAPVVFYSQMGSFMTQLVTVLHHQSQSIRLEAHEALEVCLSICQRCEHPNRSAWFTNLYDETLKYTSNPLGNAEQLHGVLLTYMSLLRFAGSFMEDKWENVCNTVLKLREVRDTKEHLVKRAVITSLPQLAKYAHMHFSKHFSIWMAFLIELWKQNVTQPERGMAFTVFSEIILLLQKIPERSCEPTLIRDLKTHMESLFSAIHTAIYKRPMCIESLLCLPPIAQAGEKAQVTDFLVQAIKCNKVLGLSQVLVTTLHNLAKTSNLDPQVELCFIQLIISTLAKAIEPQSQLLALRTLGEFNFSTPPMNLFEMLPDFDLFLNSDLAYFISTFQHTKACLQLMLHLGNPLPTQGYASTTISRVLQRTLSMAVNDTVPEDASTRAAVLKAISPCFDQHLVQEQIISNLFAIVNDGWIGNRELAITILGRLSKLNPAVVFPCLRKIFLQLLTMLGIKLYTHATTLKKCNLEFGDNKNKEDSTILLGHLIPFSKNFIKPYIDPLINRSILPILSQGSSTRLEAQILVTLRELAVVGAEALNDHLEDIVPHIISLLNDQSATVKQVGKREIALSTLGQLVRSTGYVIEPYHKWSNLLEILKKAFVSEKSLTIRLELLKVLGILGAVDPNTQKRNEEREPIRITNKDTVPRISSSHKDYNAIVVVNALMKIMLDTKLSINREVVMSSLMLSLKSLGQKATVFLPQVIPVLISLVHSCGPSFRQMLFSQLAQLTAIIKHNIHPYTKDIFNLMLEFWDAGSLPSILILAEQMSVFVNDDFQGFLPRILPFLIRELQTDKMRSNNVSRVLKSLEVFGINIEEYHHLVIPSILRLLDPNDPSLSTAHASAIESLRILVETVNVSDYTLTIVHHLVCLFDAVPRQSVRDEIMKTMCLLIRQIRSDFLVYLPMVNRVLFKNRLQGHYPRYNNLVSALQKGHPLPEEHLPEVPIEQQSTEHPPVDLFSKLKMNSSFLRQTWDCPHAQLMRDDWVEWMRRFSSALILESPSPALRACSELASDHPPLIKELFNSAFAAVWAELPDLFQEQLISCIEHALQSQTIPHDIIHTLLNLAEFMDREEKSLPIDKLGSYAQQCHAYAKALHYKELEFLAMPNSESIKELIAINQQLEQTVGRYMNSPVNSEMIVEALDIYTKKLELVLALDDSQGSVQKCKLIAGQLRCLNAIGEWNQLAQVANLIWATSSPEFKSQIAPYTAAAALHMASWERLEEYVSSIGKDSVDSNFYRAILEVHHGRYDKARGFIDATRIALLESKEAALLGESYGRAYTTVVIAQQLSELEEVMEYTQLDSDVERQRMIVKTWTARLRACKYDVDTWQHILSVHTLVIPHKDNMENWIRLVGMCCKDNRIQLAHSILNNLVGYELQPEQEKLPTHYPNVAFSYIKFLWSSSPNREGRIKAYNLMSYFRNYLLSTQADNKLKARTFLKLGEWQNYLTMNSISEDDFNEMLESYRGATECDSTWGKAWESWALINFEVVSQYQSEGEPTESLVQYIMTAIQAFVKTLQFSPKSTNQVALRLLSLMFQHGQHTEVANALLDSFNKIDVDTWLQVIPQLIARLSTKKEGIRRLTLDLLHNVSKRHPQVVLFPLTVASKSQNYERINATAQIFDRMRRSCAQLIDQVLMVCQELIRVSVLWSESWFVAIPEASHAWYKLNDFASMMAILDPFHRELEKGPETVKEKSFNAMYGRDLHEALNFCKKFQTSGVRSDIDAAWEKYTHVFNRLKRQPPLKSLELVHASDKLAQAQNLKLAVPGTYKSNQPVIEIKEFVPTLAVFQTKQHPRQLTMIGSDSKQYKFLLKGHEDMRQDERVMQLFVLVNNMLASNRDTSKSHMSIRTFAVVPLSHQSGLVEWVEQADTLHQVIREYREARQIMLNIEHKLMQQMIPNYELLNVIQKLEVFEYALDTTDGSDLEKVLWITSENSEAWLHRRNTYTRSMAVMSMVGYILGLGDRHPNNVMIERTTFQVVHIDFGDCFEIAMKRDTFPENVPFRLTRMLVNAMEVSRIEGNFRITCERVMNVLRENRGSLMAVLEAFVYDPLIMWRFDPTRPTSPGTDAWGAQQGTSDPSDYEDNMNLKALSICRRVNKKLNGTDFSDTVLSVPSQVDKVIKQATSHENLCQLYIGWCPFW